MIATVLLLFSASCKIFAQDTDTIRITFLGDVMAHTLQLNTARQAGADPLHPESYDFSSYFSRVRPLLDSADFVVANMEFPCGVRPYSGYPLFSAPESLPIEAKKSGIDLFLAANNHICDKGRAGLDSTYTIYKRHNMPFVGLYASENDEFINNPYITYIRGIRTAFINFTYGTNGFQVAEPYKVSLQDSVHLKQVIRRAKERGAEFIIVMPHWGVEYKLDIHPIQKQWAEMIYRYGADVIVGTHPHVVQKVDYDGVHATAYSLGNFISNMSIIYGQIGMVFTLNLLRNEDGSISLLPPEVVYTWCARGGKLEENYTTFPIEEYIGRRDEFIDKGQYDKMMREWKSVKAKFRIH